jgi:hypothetical protein
LQRDFGNTGFSRSTCVFCQPVKKLMIPPQFRSLNRESFAQADLQVLTLENAASAYEITVGLDGATEMNRQAALPINRMISGHNAARCP